jgi:Rrf2 family protein
MAILRLLSHGSWSVIFSKTQEYAIQALVLLAQTPAEYRLNRDVAEDLDIPAPYLAKVLKRFAQSGYLDSAKGRGGGFRIRRRAMTASVRTIAEIADCSTLATNCVIGMVKCSDHAACPVHDAWLPLRTKIATLLDRQTIAGLALKAAKSKTKLAGPAKPVAKRKAS